MALARLISRGQAGLDAFEVSVEVHTAGGLPGFTITGLPNAAVRESRDRVRAALQNCGYSVPSKRITVHLGPANVPKDGGRFDLAVALGIIMAESDEQWQVEQTEFLGELSLGGELRPITGTVPAAMAAARAGRRLILPAANGAEAAFLGDGEAQTASHLRQVIDSLNTGVDLPKARGCSPPANPEASPSAPDLDDVRGQELAKRALTIAAAGGHNLLLIGPPGSGKSMLAERLNCLLPPLNNDEFLSVACIASIAGSGDQVIRCRQRPFRAPHHTTPATALIGGGQRPLPGEVSLAHHGVLFLDELPEFSRHALEALREPLESRRVRVSRLKRQIDYPADFQLIAAMKPCPCGYHGDGTDRCDCPPARISQYRARISGPLLDRIDMHVEVPHVPFAALANRQSEMPARRLVQQVALARARQLSSNGMLNAALPSDRLWAWAEAAPASLRLLGRAQARWHLSTRALVRILKVARTIADLDDAADLSEQQLAEALQLRRLDRPLAGDGL
jgi:magnesium chelatase family protein